MVIDTVVVSSTTDPLYLELFPLVHRMWQDLVGLRCVFFLVSAELPPALEPLEGDIILVPPADGLEDAFQAQCIRLFAPQFLSKAQGVLLSDVDIIPMRKSYYLESVAAVDDDTFVVYRSDALPDYAEIAMCFNAATPQVWAEVIEPVSDLAGALEVMRNWRHCVTYSGPGSDGWTVDQRTLFLRTNAFDQRRVHRFTDSELGFRRLDRTDLVAGRESWLQWLIASAGGYTDYHMARPMTEFSATNARIASACFASVKLPKALLGLALSPVLSRIGAAIHRRLA